MFNDNYLFLNRLDYPSSRRATYHYFPYCDYHDPEEEYLSRLQQRRYQEAYLEELEHERQRQLLEERRRKRYLVELERRRQQEEADRIYRLRLQQLQQEKLQEEMIKKKRAEQAIAALMREEESKRAAQAERYTYNPNPMHYQLVRGLDGNLYKVLFDPNDDAQLISPNRSNIKSRDVEVKNEETKTGHSTAPTDSVQPPMKPSVTFQNCFNINHGDTLKPKDLKKKRSALKKSIKSSILIGDVEDASDSECEDEFSDYMHNRRPQEGEWIEPITF
jgi:hypothetical protein